MMRINRKILLDPIIFTTLFLLLSACICSALSETHMKIYYDGQNPANGVICTETTDCDSIPGYTFLSGDSDHGSKDICCVEKPCEAEKQYRYAFYAMDTAKDEFPPPEIISAYTVNYDSMKWACDSCAGIWVATADNGNGECCGDDKVGDNPSGINTNTNGDDPDMGEDACKYCKRGQFSDNPSLRNWNSNVPSVSNRCCGDDPSDCGAVSFDSGHFFICSDRPGETTTETHIETVCEDEEGLCTENEVSTQATQPGIWLWKDAKDTDNKGVILDSPCANPDVAYLSDGNQWISCSINTNYLGKRFNIYDYNNLDSSYEVENPLTVQNHDYLCYFNVPTVESPLKFTIAECCAGSASASGVCNNDYHNSLDLGGRNLFSGDSAEFNNLAFFCREDFTISQDLDDSSYACDNAKYPNGTSRNYLWTGSKCCSEPEDGKEYYNDEGGTGACFNATPIPNGHFVENRPELTAIGGILTGCRIDATNYKAGNEYLLSLKDTHTDELLIQNAEYCTVEPTGYSYCDYSEEWKPTNGKNMSNLVYIPAHWKNSSNIEAGCCDPYTCWTGDVCHPNQAPHPTWPAYKDSYRCSNGEWVLSEYKRGLDGYHGYCPQNEQCFVRLSGNYEDNDNPEADPICINDGQYITDNYCERGNWSSRTKFLSLALLDMADSLSQDYTLYCGPYRDVLNYFDYTTKDYLYVKSIFEDGMANNLCLLSSDNGLVLATSSNVDLDGSEIELSSILPEFKDCNPIEEDAFDSCNGGIADKAWIHQGLKSIVYSKSSFQLDPEPDFQHIFNSLLQNPFSALLSILKSSPPTKSFSYKFTEDSLKFDYLFVLKKAGKSITATLDESKIIVRYDGLPSEDLCQIIHSYNASHRPADEYSDAQIACTKSADTFNIISTGGEFANINPYAIWSDLTGKLRIS